MLLFFQFEITLNVLVSSFRFIWIPMIWVYDQYKYFEYFSGGDRFYTPESDVYRRQILTYKNRSRAGKILAFGFKSQYLILLCNIAASSSIEI